MTLKTIGYAALLAATAAAFSMGAPTTGEAKAKMKAAEPVPVVCPLIVSQVCAVKGGMKFTYSNACFAAKDGAKVISQGACKVTKPHKKAAKKMAKPAMKKPAAKKPAAEKPAMKKPMEKK